MRIVAGVYAIECAATGMRYIGESIDLHLRWMSHQSSIRTGKHPSRKLVSDWNQYGPDAFKMITLQELAIGSKARDYHIQDRLARLEKLYMITRFIETGNHGYNGTNTHFARHIEDHVFTLDRLATALGVSREALLLH